MTYHDAMACIVQSTGLTPDLHASGLRWLCAARSLYRHCMSPRWARTPPKYRPHCCFHPEVGHLTPSSPLIRWYYTGQLFGAIVWFFHALTRFFGFVLVRAQMSVPDSRHSRILSICVHLARTLGLNDYD